jgi:hypothetical protein
VSGNTTSFANTVNNHFGTVAGGASNYAGDGTGPTSGACCQSVGGGSKNDASGSYATIGGGQSNAASGDLSTIAGGGSNQATGGESAIAGGLQNQANGFYSAVAGGDFNKANGHWSMIPGGTLNTATGTQSFAAGCGATAANDGAFVWDGSGTGSNTCPYPVSSTAPGQFVALAPGGVIFYSNTALSAGVTLPAGSSSWATVSDRNMKDHLVPVNGQTLLARLNAIPMASWNYKAQPASIRHLGPMAQDFYAAFGLGEDDKHITTVDEGGVALAGVQALYRLSLKKDAEIQEQQAQIRTLTRQVEELEKVQRQMATLEARLAQIEARTAKPQPRSAKQTAPAKPAPGSMTLAKAQF